MNKPINKLTHVIHIPYNNSPHLNRWDLIFVIFWCNIHFDIVFAVLGVETHLMRCVRGENKHPQPNWLEGGDI